MRCTDEEQPTASDSAHVRTTTDGQRSAPTGDPRSTGESATSSSSPKRRVYHEPSPAKRRVFHGGPAGHPNTHDAPVVTSACTCTLCGGGRCHTQVPVGDTWCETCYRSTHATGRGSKARKERKKLDDANGGPTCRCGCTETSEQPPTEPQEMKDESRPRLWSALRLAPCDGTATTGAGAQGEHSQDGWFTYAADTSTTAEPLDDFDWALQQLMAHYQEAATQISCQGEGRLRSDCDPTRFGAADPLRPRLERPVRCHWRTPHRHTLPRSYAARHAEWRLRHVALKLSNRFSGIRREDHEVEFLEGYRPPAAEGRVVTQPKVRRRKSPKRTKRTKMKVRTEILKTDCSRTRTATVTEPDENTVEDEENRGRSTTTSWETTLSDEEAGTSGITEICMMICSNTTRVPEDKSTMQVTLQGREGEYDFELLCDGGAGTELCGTDGRASRVVSGAIQFGRLDQFTRLGIPFRWVSQARGAAGTAGRQELRVMGAIRIEFKAWAYEVPGEARYRVTFRETMLVVEGLTVDLLSRGFAQAHQVVQDFGKGHLLLSTGGQPRARTTRRRQTTTQLRIPLVTRTPRPRRTAGAESLTRPHTKKKEKEAQEDAMDVDLDILSAPQIFHLQAEEILTAPSDGLPDEAFVQALEFTKDHKDRVLTAMKETWVKSLEKLLDKKWTTRQEVDSVLEKLPGFVARFHEQLWLPGDPLTQVVLDPKREDCDPLQAVKLTQLADTRPSRHNPARLAEEPKKAVDDYIDMLLKNGLIRPSTSSWACRLVVVRQGGKFRVCLDLRDVNERTRREACPIGSVIEVQEWLMQPRRRIMASLDQPKGYNRIPMTPDSRHLTAFVSHRGLFEWITCPFGLANLPGAFTQIVQATLGPLAWTAAAPYMDDLFLGEPTATELYNNLVQVMERFRAYNVQVALPKSHFFVSEVKCLGSIVGHRQRTSDPDKVQRIREWERPTSLKELVSFTATVGYYRALIHGYADKVRILELFGKGMHKSTPIVAKATGREGELVWTDECDAAWQELKKSLIEAPALHVFDPELRTELAVDTCAAAIGFVLEQFKEGSNDPIPILFGSRRLTEAELKWSGGEQEALGCIWSLDQVRVYILGHPKFKIRTDCKLVRALWHVAIDRGRLGRWSLRLREYGEPGSIELIPGTTNVVPDTLSRYGYPQTEDREPMQRPEDILARYDETMKEAPKRQTLAAFLTDGAECPELSRVFGPSLCTMQAEDSGTESLTRPTHDVDEIAVEEQPSGTESLARPSRGKKVDEFSALFKQQDFIREFSRAFEEDSSTVPYMNSPEQRRKAGMELHNGWLYVVKRFRDGTEQKVLFVPSGAQHKKIRTQIIEAYHCPPHAAHRGREKLLAVLTLRFHWAKLPTEVADFVAACLICALNKANHAQPADVLLECRLAIGLGTDIEMDLMGPFPQSRRGNKYLLTAFDKSTRWIWAFALPDKRAQTVAFAFFEGVVCDVGVPERMRTDGGSENIAVLWVVLRKLLRFEHGVAARYTPRYIGACERSHAVIGLVLRICALTHENWDLFVGSALLAARTSPFPGSTLSPYVLRHGRNAPQPEDIVFRRMDDKTEASTGSNEELAKGIRSRLEHIYGLLRWVQTQDMLVAQMRWGTKHHQTNIVPGDRVVRMIPIKGRADEVSAKLLMKADGPWKVRDVKGVRVFLEHEIDKSTSEDDFMNVKLIPVTMRAQAIKIGDRLRTEQDQPYATVVRVADANRLVLLRDDGTHQVVDATRGYEIDKSTIVDGPTAAALKTIDELNHDSINRQRLKEVEPNDFVLVKRSLSNVSSIYELQVAQVLQILEDDKGHLTVTAAVYGCKNMSAPVHDRIFVPVVSETDAAGNERSVLSKHQSERRVTITLREADVHFGPWKTRNPRATDGDSEANETQLPTELADLWATVGRPRAVIPTSRSGRPHLNKREGGESQDSVPVIPSSSSQAAVPQARAAQVAHDPNSSCPACRGRKRAHTCEKGKK